MPSSPDWYRFPETPCLVHSSQRGRPWRQGALRERPEVRAFASETGSGLLSFLGFSVGAFSLRAPRLCSHSPGFVPQFCHPCRVTSGSTLASLSLPPNPPPPQPQLPNRLLPPRQPHAGAGTTGPRAGEGGSEARCPAPCNAPGYQPSWFAQD